MARSKIGGTNVNFYLLKQLPILPPSMSMPSEAIACRVSELSFTAWDAPAIVDASGGASSRSHERRGACFPWDDERRFWLRAELDAIYFHLYGISRDDVDYIMETFPIVKRKDEAKYGCYRTKLAILEVYDEMARCRAEGREYQTRLEPPPAHPSLAHDPSTRPEWA